MAASKATSYSDYYKSKSQVDDNAEENGDTLPQTIMANRGKGRVPTRQDRYKTARKEALQRRLKKSSGSVMNDEEN